MLYSLYYIMFLIIYCIIRKKFKWFIFKLKALFGNITMNIILVEVHVFSVYTPPTLDSPFGYKCPLGLC